MMAERYCCPKYGKLTEHRKERSQQNPQPIYRCTKCVEVNEVPTRGEESILNAFGLEGLKE